VEVEVKTIDNLFSGISPISFIKCDVEGAELKVILGAIQLNTINHPAWLIEICENPDDSSSSAYTLFSRMNDFGYEAYWFENNSLKKRKIGDKSTNYFFLTHEQRLKIIL